jgi:predicted RNA-binding protein YlxR (DUF448 family)
LPQKPEKKQREPIKTVPEKASDRAPKKVPMRQCLGCREMKPKKELLRVVRSPEGEVSIDLRGRANGRGAYLCRSEACLKRAGKSKALSRALGTGVSEDIVTELKRQMEETDE